MNIYEYTLVDMVTTGTVVADRYEKTEKAYLFFLTRFGVERQVYSIPAYWVQKIVCLTCAEALGVR